MQYAVIGVGAFVMLVGLVVFAYFKCGPPRDKVGKKSLSILLLKFCSVIQWVNVIRALLHYLPGGCSLDTFTLLIITVHNVVAAG